MIATIVSGGLSFLFVLLFTAVGTNLFKSRNIGQSIQEELTHHDHKSGTPTMGGLFIVAGTYFGFLLAHINFWTIGQGFKVEIDYMYTIHPSPHNDITIWTSSCKTLQSSTTKTTWIVLLT